MIKTNAFRSAWVVWLSALLASCVASTPEIPRHDPLLQASLLSHYHYWQHTPYQYGGQSRAGLDCSAYVQRVYKDVLGLQLPRTTRKQWQQGNRVSRAALRSGDLVFFKTGWKTDHVGVYLGDGSFVHASKHRGVTRSRLDEIYWRQHFVGARRIN